MDVIRHSLDFLHCRTRAQANPVLIKCKKPSAEGARFELAAPVKVQLLSRQLESATLPPLR